MKNSSLQRCNKWENQETKSSRFSSPRLQSTDSWHKFPPVFSSVKQYYSEEEEEEEECLEKSNDQYLYPRDSPSLLWKSATSDIAPYTSARIFTPVENFR